MRQEIDLDDAVAFVGAYSAESMAFFETDRLSDFSLLIERRALTLAQAVSLTAIAVVGDRDASETELGNIVGEYIRSVMDAVLSGELEARHPATFLTWEHCLGLLRRGYYGERGERAPLLHFGWVVGLEDVTQWLAGLGFNLDVSELLTDLENPGAAVVVQSANVKRWTDAFIAEVRAFRADNTAAATAARFGVSQARIREKLKKKEEGTGERLQRTGAGTGLWAGL